MGISKIRDYGAYKGVLISWDYSIGDERQVYIGNGQGCHTFWFRDVDEARKFIDYYEDRIFVDKVEHVRGLIPESLCNQCQNRYSAFSKEYKKYPPHACKELKEELIKKALEG